MHVKPIQAFKDNYIWLLETPSHVLLVDPGEAAPALAALAAVNKPLAAILITHRHRDHIGGVAQVVAAHPAPVIGPALPEASWPRHTVVGEGARIEPIAGLEFELMHLPGHTREHLAFFQPGGPGEPPRLFCGDVLFTGGCGAVFEGTMAEMQQALARIRALPGETLIYCGHEYTEDNLRFARHALPDHAPIAARSAEVAARRQRGEVTVPETLSVECATNPFLRWDDPVLIKRAAEWAGTGLATDDAVFGAVRRWKDAFDNGTP